MADDLISAALTLILEVADEVTLGRKAVDYLLRLVDLDPRSPDSYLEVCVDHFLGVTVLLFTLKFKFINDYDLVWTPLNRVIVSYKRHQTNTKK